MTHSEIHGWFDFDDIYLQMVGLFNDAHFVEVGSWLGKSSAFMALAIRDSGKRIRFDCVDIWKLTNDDLDLHKYIDNSRDIYLTFLDNMDKAGVSTVVNPIRLDSVFASKLYCDNSLDFVFIDANHNYEFIRKDIEAWYPKIKIGGYIGGHDYGTYDGVTRAVDERFLEKEIRHISWLVNKK